MDVRLMAGWGVSPGAAAAAADNADSDTCLDISTSHDWISADLTTSNGNFRLRVGPLFRLAATSNGLDTQCSVPMPTTKTTGMFPRGAVNGNDFLRIPSRNTTGTAPLASNCGLESITGVGSVATPSVEYSSSSRPWACSITRFIHSSHTFSHAGEVPRRAEAVARWSVRNC